MKKPIDENMIVKPVICEGGLKFYSVTEPPFSLHGVWFDTDCFYRVPRDTAKEISSNILDMCDTTAGGRVRFKTDSPNLAIRAKVRCDEPVSVMTPVAVKGFDVYADGVFEKSIVPEYSLSYGTVASVFSFSDSKMREITVNFPLYAAVEELFIGVSETACVTSADLYNYPTPVVFYGSSITNGASASRPGMTYESILSRRLDFDYVNLGFGGSAKGEDAMAEYIASLDMSVFVYDYDYNAPTPEHLLKTHERFFKIFRKKQPNTPVIMISAPKYKACEDRERRFEIIKKTYDNARASGDRNVYLLRGSDFFDGLDADFTVDSVHPTDLGFYFMANGIYPVLKSALEGSKI